MKVLVTGGAGFVGSHTVVALIEAGHQPVIADTLVNSSLSVLDGVEAITGFRPHLNQVDVGDPAEFAPIVEAAGFDAVIHMAAYKAVGESVEKPLRYYDNNVAGTVRMLNVLNEAGVKSIVFSSSATVYGEPKTLPLSEEMPIGTATNPYGWTKIMMEQVMADLAQIGSTMVGDAAALLQPGWRARKRTHRRVSDRRTNQLDALPLPGGGRATPVPACFRSRLRHP